MSIHTCARVLLVGGQWVNGADPWWEAKLAEHMPNATQRALLAHKYRDHNELLYSMRSVFQYAPWVRRIYLVTDGQVDGLELIT
jgi:hypothetical protein